MTKVQAAMAIVSIGLMAACTSRTGATTKPGPQLGEATGLPPAEFREHRNAYVAETRAWAAEQARSTRPIQPPGPDLSKRALAVSDRFSVAMPKTLGDPPIRVSNGAHTLTLSFLGAWLVTGTRQIGALAVPREAIGDPTAARIDYRTDSGAIGLTALRRGRSLALTHRFEDAAPDRCGDDCYIEIEYKLGFDARLFAIDGDARKTAPAAWTTSAPISLAALQNDLYAIVFGVAAPRVDAGRLRLPEDRLDAHYAISLKPDGTGYLAVRVKARALTWRHDAPLAVHLHIEAGMAPPALVGLDIAAQPKGGIIIAAIGTDFFNPAVEWLALWSDGRTNREAASIMLRRGIFESPLTLTLCGVGQERPCQTAVVPPPCVSPTKPCYAPRGLDSGRFIAYSCSGDDDCQGYVDGSGAVFPIELGACHDGLVCAVDRCRIRDKPNGTSCPLPACTAGDATTGACRNGTCGGGTPDSDRCADNDCVTSTCAPSHPGADEQGCIHTRPEDTPACARLP